MTDIVQGLFGANPQELAMQRQAALQAQGNAYAAQDPFARASSLLYQGGQGLGNAIGGMLGGQDPQMVTAAKIAAIVKNGDQTTAEGMMAIAKQFAAEGLSGPAALAQQKAQEMQLGQAKVANEQAQTAKYAAETGKVEYGMKQDMALRDALAELGPDASEADIRRVVSKFGSADKVLSTLQNAENKRAEREKAAAGVGGLGKINPNLYTPSSISDYAASLETGKPDFTVLVPREPIARAQALSSAGKQASEEGLAPGTAEFISRVKEINSSKEAAKGAEKPVSATVVKDLADTAQKQAVLIESGKKLNSMLPQIQNLDLGLVSNWFREGASAVGINTKDRIVFDRTKRELQAEANNLLIAAKGTQTEGDAQRAKDQIADENTWKNKDALSAAIKDLMDTHQRTVSAFSARSNVLQQAGKPASQISLAPMAAAPAPMAARPAAAAGVDYAAAFARAKQLNPAWANFTLEQFTAKAKQQGK